MAKRKFSEIVFGMALFLFLTLCLSKEAYAVPCESCGSDNVSEFSNVIECYGGIIEYRCNDCDHAWGITVPESHRYVSVITPASTTQTGLIEYTCTNCGNYYTEIIPMLTSGPVVSPAAAGTTGGETSPAAGGTTGGETSPAAAGTTGGEASPAAGGTTGGETGTTAGVATGGEAGSSGGATAPVAGGESSESGSTAEEASNSDASAEDTDVNGDIAGADDALPVSPGLSDSKALKEETDETVLKSDGTGFFSKQVELDGTDETASVFEFISDMKTALIGLWEDADRQTKLIIGAIAATAVAAGATYITISASKVAKAAKIAKDAELAKELGDVIELNSKKVLVCLSNEKAEKDFISHIRKRPYLTVVKTELRDAETLLKDIEENEPELLILSSACLYCIDEIKEASDGVIITVLASKESFAGKVKELKEEKKIDGYCLDKKYSEKMLVDLVLPIYKSEINVENGLEAVGNIADALGIPFVSTVTTLINEGKNVRDTIKDKDFSVSGINGIVSSIAEVMGFDGIGNITTLIDNASVVKEQKEALKTTKEAEDSENKE